MNESRSSAKHTVKVDILKDIWIQNTHLF